MSAEEKKPTKRINYSHVLWLLFLIESHPPHRFQVPEIINAVMLCMMLTHQFLR